jgi:hypothetical protein
LDTRSFGGTEQPVVRETPDWNYAMPVISRFYGVVIRMLGARAMGARFHAIYGDSELVVSIDPVRVIQGEAPPGIRELVLRWALEHQKELMTAWRRIEAGLAPASIAPLP